MTDVGIFEVYIGEVTTNMWLCPACAATRAKGKGARPPKQLEAPPGFAGRCDDCPKPETAAAVEYIPTSRGARLPTEEECPRPKPMEPWVKPKPRKQAKEAA